MYNLPVEEAQKFGIIDADSVEQKRILFLVSSRGTRVHLSRFQPAIRCAKSYSYRLEGN
jgi:hypothetical protein